MRAAGTTYADRLRRLSTELARLDDLAVAFSGGVDSTVLLHAAAATLPGRVVAIVGDSPSLPRAELEEARALAASMSVPLLELPTDELDDPAYAANAGDRCYFCKRTLFRAMTAWARRSGVSNLAFGEIADDLLDDRPGARAARELRILAPLSAAGLTKADVRRYAREAGLVVADKPASACLASRIPVGRRVTRDELARVEEAEQRLRALGFRVLRVRNHGELARVEVGAGERARAEELRATIEAALDPIGFRRLELATYLTPAERLSAGRSAAAPRAASAPGS